MFTRWVEVVPLRRHDARCVAEALVSVAAGAPLRLFVLIMVQSFPTPLLMPCSVLLVSMFGLAPFATRSPRVVLSGLTTPFLLC